MTVAGKIGRWDKHCCRIGDECLDLKKTARKADNKPEKARKSETAETRENEKIISATCVGLTLWLLSSCGLGPDATRWTHRIR
jgi:hypothetical protein